MAQGVGLEGITPENEEFHWRMQRTRKAAAVGTSLILAGALAGLFGSGPMSSTQAAASDSSFRIEYPRFARFEAPMSLVFHIDEAKAQPIDIRIQKEYLRNFAVQQISPPPVESRIEGDYLAFMFESRGSPLIKFDLRTERFGAIHGTVNVSDGAPVIVKHFIYP